MSLVFLLLEVSSIILYQRLNSLSPQLISFICLLCYSPLLVAYHLLYLSSLIVEVRQYQRLKFQKCLVLRLSDFLSGKHKQFAVVSSELSAGGVYMLFYIEDTLTLSAISY